MVSLLPQHSWTNFIYIRCQNVNCKFKVATNDQVSTPKKHKADPEKHAYPSLPFDTEDSTATEHNLSLLKQELLKPKPHFDKYYFTNATHVYIQKAVDSGW